MSREEIITYWLNSSDEDYNVMNSLFEKEHYMWTLFIGHLVLEKLLKAYYAKNVNIEVPYTHDLVKIADLANFVLTEEQSDFLDEVTTFNIKTRYPDYKDRFKKKVTREFTEAYLVKIKEVRLWLKDMIIH